MSKRVLIAEDNEQLARAMAGVLGRQGWSTDLARDGAEALGKVVAGRPDLLLLDLRLPRLPGLELLRKLRQSPRTRDLPVVVVTGALRGENHARTAAALGVAAWLEKPFRPSQLLSAVGAALNPPATTLGSCLVRAFTTGFTGCYRLRLEAGEDSLLLLHGQPLGLSSPLSGGQFAARLRGRRLLSAEEEAYLSGPGGLRPEVLAELGCLGQPELLREYLDALIDELAAGFGRPAVFVAEHPLPELIPFRLPLVNVPRLILLGFKSSLAAVPAPLDQALAARFVAPAPAFFRHVNLLPLDEKERTFLARLDGTRPLAELLAEEAELLPLLRALEALGMLATSSGPLTPAPPPAVPVRAWVNAPPTPEPAGSSAEERLESFADLVAEAGLVPAFDAATEEKAEPATAALGEKVRQAAAGLKGKDHYQVFGLSSATFTFERLKERYFALTREYGPELLMQLPGEEAALVEEILATVTTAYNTLSDVVRKERYDELLGADRVGLGRPGDERFQAQVQAQSGKVFLEMEDWDNAEKALQEACNSDPRSGDTLAHLAWAIHRNPKNAASRALQEKARQLLNRSLTLERTAAGFAFKGWMLLEAGQELLAEGEFAKALKLDARHPLARRGLRALQEKREQEKKGLLRRWFG